MSERLLFIASCTCIPNIPLINMGMEKADKTEYKAFKKKKISFPCGYEQQNTVSIPAVCWQENSAGHVCFFFVKKEELRRKLCSFGLPAGCASRMKDSPVFCLL